MTEDTVFLVNYKPNHLYTNPVSSGKGTYVTLVGDGEYVVGEVDVTSRCKLAVTAFYVKDRADFGTIKITRIQFNQRLGWQAQECVQINRFQAAQMKEFVGIISSLDLRDAQKTRISLGEIHFGALGALLSSTQGTALLSELAASPELHHDIYAVASKRAVVAEFEAHLRGALSEAAWQAFFEQHPWIFGHGLNYVFLSKVGRKLETQTTGAAYDRPGKRADGLMLTKAEISQYVLVEIKKNHTDLLQVTKQGYRSGCWGVSRELSDAVTQTQKTAFDFSKNRFRDHLTDEYGNDTSKTVYAVEPRSYLVIGNLSQLQGNDDKIACFELYRRNIRAPEILTFDELFQRARCIVENLSKAVSDAAIPVQPEHEAPAMSLDDDIPF